MNILLLGSGGREHALAWKLAQSELCSQLYIAPGNAGTALCGENIHIDVMDFSALASMATTKNIELIVVGPDDPICAGAYDFFTEKGFPTLAPSQAAAQLEGSKSYAKKFMQRHHIPTAAYLEVTQENLDEGLRHIQQTKPPYVLKADGLAAGKGVLILPHREEAERELRGMIEEAKFGDASAKVVIETFLEGIEFSVFVLTDGINYKILPTAKDYKRIGEGEKGLNTGGMGAISPVPFVDEALMKKVEERIIQPTIQGLQKDKLTYKGIVYFGLIKVGDEPMVIEYNCRLGDPETEVILPRLQNDLVAILQATLQGNLADQQIEEDERACCTVVLASEGYPTSFEKNKLITNINLSNDSSLVFFAGVKKVDNQWITSGGRVLMLSSLGATLQAALTNSLSLAEAIQFENKYYRKDIGFEFL